MIDIFSVAESVESSEDEEDEAIIKVNDRAHKFPEKVYPFQLTKRAKVWLVCFGFTIGPKVQEKKTN